MILQQAAFWFSLALVCYWAYGDFHRPFDPNDLRYATAKRRYVLAASMHIGVAGIIFLLALLMFMVVFRKALGEELAVGLPLASALIVTLLLPDLPITGEVLAEVRGMAQRLALFPGSANRLAALLAAQSPLGAGEAGRLLDVELGRYGVEEGTMLRILQPGAVRLLMEAHSIHRRFETTIGEARLLGFFAARSSELVAARLEHRHLLRQVARALMLVDDLVGERLVEKQSTEAVSDFVAEESEALRAHYVRLIAEAALSCFRQGRERSHFLAGLGYDAPPDRDLPYWAVVSILALVPINYGLFLLPLLLMPLGYHFPPPAGPHPPNPAFFAPAFTIQQLAVVLWAVVPKLLTRSCRPSFRSIPWVGNVIAAVVSYTTAVLFQLLLHHALGDRDVPLERVLWTSLFGPVITLGLCLQIDFRLLSRSVDFVRGRWSNAGQLAVAALVTHTLVAQVMAHAGFDIPTPVRIMFAVVLVSIAAATGYLVPSSVAAYLREREADAERLGQQRSGGTTLAARIYRTSAAAE